MVKVRDPAELLTCRAWPKATGSLAASQHQVDDLVALIAAGRSAYDDCALKLKGIATFQAQ